MDIAVPDRSDSGTDRAVEPERIRRWLPALLPLPLWLLLTYVLFAPLIKDMTGPLPGGADATLYAWYFKEIQVAVWNLHNPFFTTDMNAPIGLNLMWNTAILLPAFLMTPITAAFGATLSVAILMVIAPISAAAVAYWVLHRLTGSLPGAAIGASFYGFGPFFNSQQGHVHLTLGAVSLPLILYFGYQMITSITRSWRQIGWRLGVVVGITMLVSEEIVAIAGVVALLCLVVLAIRFRTEYRARRAFVLKSAGWAAGVAACICGPALTYQFFGPLVISKGIHSNLSIDLVATVRPGYSMYFSTAGQIQANQQFINDGAENSGYLGVVLIIAAIASYLVLRRTDQPRLAFWLGSSTLVAFTLSLGTSIRFNGHQTYIPMPWILLCRVPVIDTIVPARFSLATVLMVGALLAFALASLQRLPPRRTPRRSRSKVTVAGYALAVLALALCWPSPGSRYLLPVSTPEFFRGSDVQAITAGSVVLPLPQDGTPNSAVQLMKWQMDADMRFSIIGGYSYFSRDGNPYYQAELPLYAQILQEIGATGAVTTAQLQEATVSLRSSVGDYVVVARSTEHVQPLLEALQQIAGCTPQPIADVYLCQVVR